MALVKMITLKATSDYIDVASVVKADGTIELSVASDAPIEDKVIITRERRLFYGVKDTPVIVRIRKEDQFRHSYHIFNIDGSRSLLRMPKISKLHRGVAARINRFLGCIQFRIDQAEMDAWAASVTFEMRRDGHRHARNLVK